MSVASPFAHPANGRSWVKVPQSRPVPRSRSLRPLLSPRRVVARPLEKNFHRPQEPDRPGSREETAPTVIVPYLYVHAVQPSTPFEGHIKQEQTALRDTRGKYENCT